MTPYEAQIMSDPELAQQMAQLGSIPDEQKLALLQYGQGNDLFSTPGAKGMEVGHTYVASSPLEHLAVALQRAMGAGRMSKATGGMRDLIGRQTAGRSAYADALSRYFGGQQPDLPEQPLTMPQMVR